MRIGIDCRIYSPLFTGIGRYTFEIAEHLLKANALSPSPYEFVLFFNNPEFDSFKPDSHSKKVLVNSKHYSFSEQTRFLRKLNKENLDLMFFPHFNVPIFYRRPYIVTIHDLTLSLFPGRKMTKWFHRLAYYITIKNAVVKAKKIITISNNTKRDLMDLLKVPEEKIQVIYNGVSDGFTFIDDPKILEKTLQKYNIKKEFLLYTGVWRSHKNLARLIEAFAILKNQKGLNLNLVITGHPDPYYPEVKTTVKKFHLEPDVIFTGLIPEEDLVHLYNTATIYVFPSLYEGFGLPPLEAMKCGTPVAAANSSSIPEICGDGNAIFFDPYSPEDIAEKIQMLYKDADLRAKLKERGLDHAAKFTWKSSSAQVYQLIQELL